jgi:hypothetical protein
MGGGTLGESVVSWSATLLDISDLWYGRAGDPIRLYAGTERPGGLDVIEGRVIGGRCGVDGRGSTGVQKTEGGVDGTTS